MPLLLPPPPHSSLFHSPQLQQQVRQHCTRRCQSLSMPSLCLQSVSTVCASLYAGISVPPVSPAPRQTADGHAACELCGRQLSKVKHHHRCGPGHACHPRCKQRGQPVRNQQVPVTATAPAVTPRKRRATSDPGELPKQPAVQALTHRVTAAEPASASKKQYNTRREEQIMRLLDETHARRMAAEAADGSSAMR